MNKIVELNLNEVDAVTGGSRPDRATLQQQYTATMQVPPPSRQAFVTQTTHTTSADVSGFIAEHRR